MLGFLDICKGKGLVVFGCAFKALTKPMFVLASSSGVVFRARLLDRVGKGMRGSPQDEMLADISPPELRGTAYGLFN